MATTVIRGTQILNNTVQRQDLDTSTVGQAVVTKLVQGSGITLSSTGADSGTGDVTVSSVSPPLADATQNGLLRQVSGNTTDFIDGTNNSQPLQPVLWSVRLRTYQALSNNAFEVDQRNTGAALTNPANGTFIQDRWSIFKSAGLTGTVNTALQSVPTAPIVVPGTNFGITQNYQRFTVGTAQASLAAGDFWGITQSIEGPRWRELALDVHSLEILVRSSLAGTFALRLRDSTTTHSLVKLCTISAANTWTLIQLPNLPVWVGTYSAAAGQIAYLLDIFLACGSTYLAAASAAWQAADIRGVTGMSNFLATAGATWDIAFIQNEPGALCTTPIDCPFMQAYDDALRYFEKSYTYPTAVGTAGTLTYAIFNSISVVAGSFTAQGGIKFRKSKAKTPTCTCYNHSTGAVNSAYSYYATSGTVPTLNANLPATATYVSADSLAAITTSGTSTSPVIMMTEWVADTGW